MGGHGGDGEWRKLLEQQLKKKKNPDGFHTHQPPFLLFVIFHFSDFNEPPSTLLSILFILSLKCLVTFHKSKLSSFYFGPFLTAINSFLPVKICPYHVN